MVIIICIFEKANFLPANNFLQIIVVVDINARNCSWIEIKSDSFKHSSNISFQDYGNLSVRKRDAEDIEVICEKEQEVELHEMLIIAENEFMANFFNPSKQYLWN